jgi:hypothetical protein
VKFHRVRTTEELNSHDKYFFISGIDVGLDRWQKVYQTWEPHFNDHILSFNDAHLMMALVGSKQPEEKINEFIASLENYVSAKYGNERTTNQK